ncbi:SBBP repeat-containing protein [Hymenobacter terrenus]|uniref:SBBP repeat-containing protein n=1 Tax=Hymenobacter terrenus TaxID=1629124 RepID=UPI000619EA81|nr:SBBP repeat-containing protein [Hymenobacter terrenus]
MKHYTFSQALRSRLGLLALLGLATGSAQAQTAPTWSSVQTVSSSGTTQLGEPSYSSARDIAIASDGSRYVTGFFDGTINLGAITLTAGGVSTPAQVAGHVFLAKYDPAGTVLWAKKFDSYSSDVSAKVAVDAAGNAYLAGDFYNSLDLGTTTLTSAGNDGYLIKFDAQGVQQWVRQGGAFSTTVGGIAVDASNNVVIAGSLSNTVSFGGPVVSGRGQFFYKFSPTGTVVLAQKFGTSPATIRDLALDTADNAYITGSFSANATFGPVTLSSAGYTDVFLCKLDATGNNLWAQSAGGPDFDRAESVAVDSGGNPVVSGYYDDDLVAPIETSRIYVARYSTQGTPLWNRLITPNIDGFYSATGVAYDGRGGYYVTGGFQGTAVFGTTTINVLGGEGLFVARYDSQGTVVWADAATNATNNDFSSGYGVATDSQGNAYVTGSAIGKVKFGSLPIINAQDGNALVAKLTAAGVLTATRAKAATVTLPAYPNPASGHTSLDLPAGGGHLVLIDALGRTVREQSLPTAAGSYPVSLEGLKSGLYQLRAALNNGKVASTQVQVR